MTSDDTYELRVHFVDAGEAAAFEIKEEVKLWFVAQGEPSFVEGALDGDNPEELETSCLPISLYSFDQHALAALCQGLEARFGSRVVCTVHRLANTTWQEDWRRDFQPIETRCFYVVPLWQEEACPRPGKILVRVNPGRAFGDAQHETTQLCLKAIEDISDGWVASRRLLDVGTGTGILAIAAKKLGWGEVVGTDIAADAILASQENAAANAAEVAWHRGSFPADETSYDAIVANIFGPILRGMAETLSQRLKAGGWLILSGIIEEEGTAMRDCFKAYGLQEAGRHIKNGWMAMVLRK